VHRLGERIWRASEGNPFMVRETVLALREREADDLPAEIFTPPRVREVIAGRLDRLSDRGRLLAAVASVIGRECDFALLERAAGYRGQAGTAAAARAAHREALACVEQALEALRRLPAFREVAERTIDLRFEIRQSYVPLREPERMLEHLREAQTQAEAIEDRARLGWALIYRAHGLFLSGDSHGAIESGQRGLAIAEALEDPYLQESANFYLAQVC